MVHLSETCDQDLPYLIVAVHHPRDDPRRRRPPSATPGTSWRPTGPRRPNTTPTRATRPPQPWTMGTPSTSTGTPGRVLEGRQIVIGPRTLHDIQRRNRADRDDPAWKRRYNRRAGIERTISQGVRGFAPRPAGPLKNLYTHHPELADVTTS
jgi:hypothetical protein